MKGAVAFEQQVCAVRSQVLDVCASEAGDLCDFLGRNVVAPHVHGGIAVRQKVDVVSHPQRMDVGGVLVGQEDFAVVLQIQDAQRGVLPPSVDPPLLVPPPDAVDHQGPAIRRVLGIGRPLLRGQGLRPPVLVYGPYSVVPHGCGVARRSIVNARAIRRPAPGHGAGRMKGQPLGCAPFDADDIHAGRSASV